MCVCVYICFDSILLRRVREGYEERDGRIWKGGVGGEGGGSGSLLCMCEWMLKRVGKRVGGGKGCVRLKSGLRGLKMGFWMSYFIRLETAFSSISCIQKICLYHSCIFGVSFSRYNKTHTRTHWHWSKKGYVMLWSSYVLTRDNAIHPPYAMFFPNHFNPADPNRWVTL